VTQCGPVLNADMMFKHIRTDTVWDLMQQMRTRPGWEAAIEFAFSHKSVLISYSDPKKSVIIDKVRMDLSPQSTFDLKGTPTTYADYVKSKYGLMSPDLDKKQPLLENVSRTKRDKDGKPVVSHFIPSLCKLTGQTDEMKNDRFRCRELIKLTAVPPGQRITQIQETLSMMVSSEGFHKAFDPWGIEIVPKLLKFPARRLPAPLLRNASGPIHIQDDSQSWQVKGRFDTFLKASCFDNWAVLAFQKTNEAMELIDNLMAIGSKDMGIAMKPPQIFDTAGDRRPQAFKSIIETQIKKLSPNFLVVVIPVATDEPYKTVKQMLGQYGVPSQFVTNKALEKDGWTKAIMIMMQMNCKGGGAPWTVDLKFQTPTMVVGLDIHHGGDLEHKGGSVAGYVASLNRECTRYYSRTFIVKPKQQEFEKLSPEGHGLKELTVEAIKRFKVTNNNAAPKIVVVYRDGGSEGELSRITKYEVAQFQAAFKDAGIECKLAFIVVLKKIRTRFFMVNPNNDKEVSNPPPGTIIDRFITNAVLPEFLLCCQHVNQGSATPTKYQLIQDDTGLNADTLEMYTYCLSHLYFNWPGTIRVPAPMKYASTIAKFDGLILRGLEVNAKMWERLHYL
jgi:aubergine-like protein